jgi:hypothetical protein
MTLAELEDIGREIGISADVVRKAAQAIDHGGRPTERRFLGLPIGVGRTIDLGRKLSDEEWDHFVVDLRETFDARGRLQNEGSFRQWTNGNLQALLEPTATGHRIRLRTIKGDARSMMVGGLSMLGIAGPLLVVAATRGDLGDPGLVSAIIFLATMGAGMLGVGAMRVPGWARTRERQMEELAARVSALANADSPRDALKP